jgi:ornithine carbamoyltransferase
MTTRHPGSLLKELDLDKAQFLALVTRAAELKRAKAEGTERLRLTGKNIALIFEKSSTRTRCAFDVAAHDQGAHTTYLGPEGSHIGREESIPDTARVLGRMFDGIEFRGFAQDTVEQLADHAGVPVWNGLTDSWHPTQMLADILTMTEHHPGPVEDQLQLPWRRPQQVARSLLVTGAPPAGSRRPAGRTCW